MCPLKRRSFLSLSVNAVGAAITGAVLVPACIYAIHPALRKDESPLWNAIGSLDEYRLNVMHERIVELPAGWNPRQKLVFVWRPTDSEVVVFSRACTDLGCPINWDESSQCFYCPCHGGIFSKEGERMAGPPNRPLWRYATRTLDGALEIDLRSVPPMA
ncbi:MAG: ubiquinol-cytochrome c reductase iron-sulfur subunit [Deltaproteobacteria bacterium]|nr:ubiquinol-cytochrome c reductase iron-sulfur subunit [Deltaproteobacteria bacterium]